MRSLRFLAAKRGQTAADVQPTLNNKTMLQVCKYNPLCDVSEVRQDLVIDIAEAMASGVVPSYATDNPYTKDMQISEVGHYLRDKISVAMAAQQVGASLASQKASAAAAVSQQVANQ